MLDTGNDKCNSRLSEGSIRPGHNPCERSPSAQRSGWPLEEGRMAAPGTSEAAAPARRSFRDCWGCRAVCGGGLVAASGYVYASARRVLQKGGPTQMGTVGQIVFALSLLSLGLVVIADPVGKSHPKYRGAPGPQSNRPAES